MKITTPLLLISCGAYAQNGRVLSQAVVRYPDSLRAARIRQLPRFQAIFDQTETLAITYLSGGLKIQGYVLQPTKPGKYPCVIFCRGGHEDFGQLDLLYLTVLADVAQHGYVVIASQLRGTPGSEGKDEFPTGSSASAVAPGAASQRYFSPRFFEKRAIAGFTRFFTPHLYARCSRPHYPGAVAPRLAPHARAPRRVAGANRRTFRPFGA